MILHAEQLLIDDTIIGTNIDTPQLQTGVYYWRYRATNSHGKSGPWSNASSFSVDLFSWRFGNNKDDFATDFVITDAGYVVVGTTQDSSLYDDIYVVYLDYAGNKIWEKRIGGSSSDLSEYLMLPIQRFIYLPLVARAD